jgi:hypothetical protein
MWLLRECRLILKWNELKNWGQLMRFVVSNKQNSSRKWTDIEYFSMGFLWLFKDQLDTPRY